MLRFLELPSSDRAQAARAGGPPEGSVQGVHHGQFRRVAAGVRLYIEGRAACRGRDKGRGERA